MGLLVLPHKGVEEEAVERSSTSSTSSVFAVGGAGRTRLEFNVVPGAVLEAKIVLLPSKWTRSRAVPGASPTHTLRTRVSSAVVPFFVGLYAELTREILNLLKSKFRKGQIRVDFFMC